MDERSVGQHSGMAQPALAELSVAPAAVLALSVELKPPAPEATALTQPVELKAFGVAQPAPAKHIAAVQPAKPVAAWDFVVTGTLLLVLDQDCPTSLRWTSRHHGFFASLLLLQQRSSVNALKLYLLPLMNMGLSALLLSFASFSNMESSPFLQYQA